MSIEPVRKDGKVVRRDGAVVYRVRWREAGRNRSRVIGRKADAKAFEAEIERRRRSGGLLGIDASRQTVTEWAEEWWDAHAAPNLSASTLRYYAWLLDHHLAPRVGGMRLAELTPEAVGHLRSDMERSGVPPATTSKALTLLGGILERAVEAGRLERNPTRSVRKPKVPRRREVRPLAPETVEAIRTRLLTTRQGTGGLRGSAALLGQRDATLVSVLAYAGLRPRSEALELRWGQVRDRTILVHASKTGRSRSVRLLGPLARDLAEWRMRCGRPGDSELVFPRSNQQGGDAACTQSSAKRPATACDPAPSPSGDGAAPAGGNAKLVDSPKPDPQTRHTDGQPWSEHSYRRWRGKVYEPAAIACGAEEGARHPYALRHSYASLLIAEGQTVVEVAEQLGHSPAMCLRTYAHVLAEHELGSRVPAEERIRAAREDRQERRAV